MDTPNLCQVDLCIKDTSLLMTFMLVQKHLLSREIPLYFQLLFSIREVHLVETEVVLEQCGTILLISGGLLTCFYYH